MTTFHYRTKRFPQKRAYLLEVNPHYVIRDDSDKDNVIDARWIDMTSGLFIDITTARYDENHYQGPNIMVCKDGHQFRASIQTFKQAMKLNIIPQDTYIFPLLDTVFEGEPVKIPNKYKDFLVAEYGLTSLTNKRFAK